MSCQVFVMPQCRCMHHRGRSARVYVRLKLNTRHNGQ